MQTVVVVLRDFDFFFAKIEIFFHCLLRWLSSISLLDSQLPKAQYLKYLEFVAIGYSAAFVVEYPHTHEFNYHISFVLQSVGQFVSLSNTKSSLCKSLAVKISKFYLSVITGKSFHSLCLTKLSIKPQHLLAHILLIPILNDVVAIDSRVSSCSTSIPIALPDI